MASSVARRPTSDDWRDHRRLAATVLSAAHNRTSFSPSNLKNAIICRRQPGDASTSASAAATSSSSTEALAVAAGEDGGDSPGTVRRRQKRILDPWAAREAREMVTTIQTQARKADLSTLTTAPPPVSVRSASLLREASPSPFDFTVVSSLDTPDSRRNVRASSLIQMWRELEAEGGLTPRNRPSSGGSTPENAAAVASFTGAISDGSDESDVYGDWNSDAVSTPPSEPVTSISSSLNEAEKNRVVSIVKKLSTGHGASCSMAAMGHENEASGRATAADKVERLQGKGAVVLSSWRLRGRGDMERFVARMEQERRRELVTLAEHHQASRFSFRGRLQSMLKLRSLQRKEAVQDRMRAPSCRFESNKKHSGLSISFIRERFDYRGRDCGSSKPILASTGDEHVQFPASTEGTDYPRIVNVELPINTEGEEGPNYTSRINVQFPMDAEGSGYASSPDHCTSDTIQCEEIASPGDLVCSPRETNDDIQEGNQSIGDSWNERNLWVSNPDWPRPTDSPSNGWHSEVVAEAIESSPQQNISSLASGDDNSRRGWSIRRRSPCHDSFEFSDNVEIRDLLERRRVSTSLESEFCGKMNQLILSFLQQQAQLDETYEDDQVNHPYIGHSIGHRSVDLGESISSSLITLPYHPSPCPESLQHISFARQSSQNISPESLQHISFTRQSSQNILDSEAIHDLRSEMSQIHEEINQLRLMVEGCLGWQAKLQQSIKQDIMDAINQSVGMANSSQNFSVKSARMNTCCICCEKQVDSLLYRCGHMCACYNCAYYLQWSNGNCPICQSQIVDVVRAFSNS